MSYLRPFLLAGINPNSGDYFTMSGGYVFPTVSPDASVLTKTSNYTITSSDMGKIIKNTGASAGITLSLPAASLSLKGKVIRVAVVAAQTINVSPTSTQKVYFNGLGATNKDLILPASAGAYADIYCDGDNWFVTNYSGNLTKES